MCYTIIEVVAKYNIRIILIENHMKVFQMFKNYVHSYFGTLRRELVTLNIFFHRAL